MKYGEENKLISEELLEKLIERLRMYKMTHAEFEAWMAIMALSDSERRPQLQVDSNLERIMNDMLDKLKRNISPEEYAAVLKILGSL